MEYLVSGEQGKEIDQLSIKEYKISSLLLMERGAQAVVDWITKNTSPSCSVLCVCGTGNNGGDSVAVGRLLHQEGYEVTLLLLGDQECYTKEMHHQLQQIKNLNIAIRSWREEMEAYDVIVDGIFGIGLSRDVEGVYFEVIQWINEQKKMVVSIDIPSGIHSSSGKVLGIGVHANVTITFGFPKIGCYLYPGCSYSHHIVVADIGFAKQAIEQVAPKTFTLHPEYLRDWLPKREEYSHKGCFGKIFVIAGSSQMNGACYFTAKAGYRVGCGLVQIGTPIENTNIIQTLLPEGIVFGYQDNQPTSWLQPYIQSSDVIVFGPGIGLGEYAKKLLHQVLKEKEKPIIIDGDGLTLLAQCSQYFTPEEEHQGRILHLPSNVIITPHLKEMSRLIQKEVSFIQNNLLLVGKKMVQGGTVVLKDARTIVINHDNIYINTTGNHGMATGGSGDVLAGMIGGFLGQHMSPFKASVLGVFLHGLAGDHYSKRRSPYSLMASDLLEEIPRVLSFDTMDKNHYYKNIKERKS